jgi:hypothetical protein
MAYSRRRSEAPAKVISFFLGAVVLSAFMRTGTAFGQCGPVGSATANNTACGDGALTSNTMGTNDSAFGFSALKSNTQGSDNTAIGESALPANTTGNNNTANGEGALFNNTTGSNNTASGASALGFNTTGGGNTASGVGAMQGNTTGYDNTASGQSALASNTTGIDNTADGEAALDRNSKGNNNTASGFFGLSNSTGNNNIGLGFNAGVNIRVGSSDIDIGNAGSVKDAKTIRIGVNGTQNETSIAGISSTQVLGDVVEVSSNGQLGIAMSSVRYKRDIRDVGSTSAGLMKLRPVSFRYKNDPSGTLQYGLVAEDVAKVYPELVTRGPDGKIQSVHYLEFTALLLNELQKQDGDIQRLSAQVISSEHQVISGEQKIAQLQASHDREFRALKATFEQRLSAMEQTNHRGTVYSHSNAVVNYQLVNRAADPAL